MRDRLFFCYAGGMIKKIIFIVVVALVLLTIF